MRINFIAKIILKKIIGIISVKRTNQDIITSHGRAVMIEYTFKTMRDNEETYDYNIGTGIISQIWRFNH